MIYGSVCSGIEAASVAWHPLGWKASFVSEIDNFPRAVLAHHYPEVPLHGDFTTIQYGDYRPIDLLVGGTPCQSFSVAGLRGGLDDDRGNLALEFLKLAQRLRPRWVVWENVPGVLSSNGGRDFGSILAGLGEVGYGFAHRVLDAQYFGLAQRRKRVFVVGYLGDWRRAAAVLFEREGLRGDTAPSRKARKGIAGGFECGPVGGRLTDLAPTLDTRCKDKPIRNPQPGDPFHPITAQGHVPAITFGAQNSSHQGDGVSVDFCPTLDKSKTPGVMQASAVRRLTPMAIVPFDTTQITSPQNGSKPKPGDPCHPIMAKGHAPAVAFQERGRDGGRSLEINGDLAYAMTAPNGGGRAQERNILAPDMSVRRLTPTECERLQGFPDGYTLIPYRGKPAADGPRYKALGNSMAVPVMRWIGERIQMVEDLPC